MNRSTPVYLSIVVPCFNEARRLPGSLEQLVRHLGPRPYAIEIIVVVERSTDGTAGIAAEIAAREPDVIVIANDVQRGKGFAIRTGVLRARGEVIFTMDADLSVPVSFIDVFLQYFERHPTVDVLAGNRQHHESDVAVRQNRPRECMGQFFNTLVRATAGGELRDTQCGFKAFRHKAAAEIFARQTIDGFACDVEVLMLAERLGFQVRDLPVQWFNSSESKVRLWRDPWRMLFDLLRVRRRVRSSLERHPPARQ